MSKRNIITLSVLIGLAVIFYVWNPFNIGKTGSFTDAPSAPQGKLMSIDSYIAQNISDLSPVKETVGGKFYVTSIIAEDGKGVVSYEDGHNAYTADFTYTSSDQSGYRINSFVIRD
jgi:hypothetical protein